MKYKYKENHLYIYTLIQNTNDTDMLLSHPLITFARSKPTFVGNNHHYFINFNYST